MSLGSPSVSLTGREWGLGGAPHSRSDAHPLQGGCPPSPAAAGPCCRLPARALLGSLLAPTCPSGRKKPVCRGKGRGNSVGGRPAPPTSHLGQLPGPGPPSPSGLRDPVGPPRTVHVLRWTGISGRGARETEESRDIPSKYEMRWGVNEVETQRGDSRWQDRRLRPEVWGGGAGQWPDGGWQACPGA